MVNYTNKELHEIVKALDGVECVGHEMKWENKRTVFTHTITFEDYSIMRLYYTSGGTILTKIELVVATGPVGLHFHILEEA